ncbi:hypothetical protein SmJEL517_g00036 [Synchytrium microbalum]|uniref:Aldehyde dehydrogenase domain-containing protein n=1 Tax=Synchytrium microbalum TaxID=1806994 RepID=A0A507CFH5_9FUNG|nr:uncharacterized protein SmJEL517_g00036 [Synchytrium microbalum]TPX38251.1 hypothetical protein SmJEL517_g00036 [Synchytrium microbalum]
MPPKKKAKPTIQVQETVSPGDGKVFVTRDLTPLAQAQAIVEKSRTAQKEWKSVPLNERIRIVTAFVDDFVSKKAEIGPELTSQMGRPIKYGPNEVKGFEERARYLISIAEESLQDVKLPKKDGFNRYIKREALGVVMVIGVWNYPYLVTVNAVIPAIIAGNSVVLKQAPQTPLCAERFAESFKVAGLPDGVFEYIHMSNETCDELISTDGNFEFVQFTGSVRGGKEIAKAASSTMAGVGLELGGNDPAYVRADADLDYAADNIVDGALYNSGQSCCAVERVYVHEKVFDEFVKKAVDIAKAYKLGDPMDETVTLGPVISAHAATNIRAAVKEALAKGAKAMIDESGFPMAKAKTPYVAPQVLIDVDHTMKVMTDETFGPILPIMKVSSDEEAIRLMNDSQFGLTASVWTRDEKAAVMIADQIEAGTVFANRCDYLDPALTWAGMKMSGRGVTLSTYGYDSLTRPKSYHLKAHP